MARVLSDSHDVGDEHLDPDHSGGYGIVPFRVVGEEDEPKDEEDETIQNPEENLGAVVLLEFDKRCLDHRPFKEAGFFQHAFEVVTNLLGDLSTNQLNWSATLAILDSSVSTLQKEGSHRSSRLERFDTHHSKMKGSEPVVILSLEVDTLEAKKVALGAFGLVEDGPVKWCSQLQIFLINVHALNFDKVVNTDSLVPLSRHM